MRRAATPNPMSLLCRPLQHGSAFRATAEPNHTQDTRVDSTLPLVYTQLTYTLVVILRSVLRLLVTANVDPSSPILVTLMMEALSSSEMSVLTRATRRNIPEDAILHNHRRENLKSYKASTGWAL
jgi:hypothetical protein